MQADGKTILLVEDNPQDEELTVRALRKHNLANEIVVAHVGEEALDYLFGRGAHAHSHPERPPQVVLLDIKLPKVDGLEVLAQIRSHEATKFIPVVMLTSSDEQQDVAKSYQLGVNSYIRKPVEFGEFAEAVRQLGLYWILLNKRMET